MITFAEYMKFREDVNGMSDAIRQHLAGITKMDGQDVHVFGNLPVDSFKKQLLNQLPKAIPWFKQQGIPAETVYSAVGQLQSWAEGSKTVNDLVKSLSGEQPADQTQPEQQPIRKKPRPEIEPQPQQQPQMPGTGQEAPIVGMS